MDVTSSAGSCFSVAGCCALAKERNNANVIGRKMLHLNDMDCSSLNWRSESNVKPYSISGTMWKLLLRPSREDREIAFVWRKDRINFFVAGKIDQRHIYQWRMNILIPSHQGCNCFRLRAG